MDLNESLYREHLEEISTLYDQRLHAGRLGSLSWVDFADMEERLEPHLDALVIGGDHALRLCEERSMAGDYGECYGAVRLICRKQHQLLLEDLLDRLNLSDSDTSQAVEDALCQELPPSYENNVIHGLLHKDPASIRLAARVIAFRRLDFAAELYDILHLSSRNTAMVIDILHTLGRIRPSHGAERILSFLHSTDKTVVDAAVTALVRIGERRVLRECMTFIGPGDWPKLSLGLYGDRHALTDSFFSASVLDDDAQSKISREYVIAAGLLGNIQAVTELITYLDIPDLSETAALSLFLITGADLEEEVFVKEEVDPDELFDDERKLWEKGLHFEGKSSGRLVHRLSRNPKRWSAWWKENKGQFKLNIRYRNGKPYSPHALLENLKSKKSPELLRELSYEELVIRYGIDIPFNTRMTVHQQFRAIETMMIRLDGNPDGFKPGLWYYNRRPISDLNFFDDESLGLEDELV